MCVFKAQSAFLDLELGAGLHMSCWQDSFGVILGGADADGRRPGAEKSTCSSG